MTGPGLTSASHPARRLHLDRLSASPWTFVLIVVMASRLFDAVIGSLLVHAMPVDPFHEKTADNPFGTLNLWAHFDGAHYVDLAEHGYPSGSAAFFPLYPLLVRVLAALGGGPITPAGLSVFAVAVSLAALPVALWFVHRIAEHEVDGRAARSAVLLTAFFPTAFFFGAAYTESVFLALSAGAIWALRVRRDLLLACVLVGLATATRNVGVFLFLPLLVECWAHRREFGRDAAWLALAPSGLIVFASYLWVVRGDPLAFLHDQSQWGRSFGGVGGSVIHAFAAAGESGSGLLDPANFRPFTVERLLTTLSGLEYLNNVVFVVVALLAVVLATRVLPWHLTAYAACLVVVPVFFGSATDPLMGSPRYVLVAFPLFVAAAAHLGPRAVAVITALGALTSVPLIGLFVNWHFVA